MCDDLSVITLLAAQRTHMDRSPLIERLVSTGHLNVPERRALGQMTREEVVAAVKVALERDGGFPLGALNATDAIYEGPQIKKTAEGYLGINQRSGAINPTVVAESAERSFPDAESVVAWYINQEWGGAIDGIPFANSGPIDLDSLVDLGSECPYTFLAFPSSGVNEHGVPTDVDAQRYIAAVQAAGVSVGIWLTTPVKGTAYAAVAHDSIPLLHRATEQLSDNGDFRGSFAADLCERLFSDAAARGGYRCNPAGSSAGR